jgi:transposase
LAFRKDYALVREVLKELSHNLGKLYSLEGQPSIPPEQLPGALPLQVFYGIRSERQLMEQLNYNLLFRWFIGLSPDDPVWDVTRFIKNRDRLQGGDVFRKFMDKAFDPSKGHAVVVGRALFGRRYAHRSLGLAQEFQAERWF